MSKSNAFKRLLWKEFREDRFIILTLFLAPALLYTVANSPALFAMREIFIRVANMGAFVLLILWAAIKGDREKRGSEYSLTHLPVRPIATWITSFLFPAIIAAALGFWSGGWNNTLSGWQLDNGALLGMLEFLATYSFCYYFAAAFSKWLAIIIGVAHVGSGGTLISSWDHTVTWDIDAILFTISVAASAITASWIFLWLSNRKPLQIRQAISLFIMVFIAFIPAARGIDVSWFSGRESDHGGLDWNNYRSDAPVKVEEANKHGKWYMVDLTTGRKLYRQIGKSVTPMGIDRRNRAFFVQPASKGKMNIIRWDTVENSVRTVAALPAGFDFISVYGSSLDPDGRYLLLFTKSLLGEGQDILLIDLNNGRNRIAMPGTNYENMLQVVWLKNRVMITLDGMAKPDYMILVKPLFSGSKVSKAIYEDDKIFSIDLKTAKATRITLRGGKG